MKTIDEILADAELGPVVAAHVQAESAITSERLGKLLETPEGFNSVRAHFDAYAGKAMKTFALNHPPANVAAEKLTKRLEKLEAAHTASIAAGELRFHVFKKAAELGVDYSLVSDLRFDNEKAADAKLAALAVAVGKKKSDDINRELAGSFKPGAGSHSDAQGQGLHEKYLASLTPADRAAVESSRRGR